VIYYYSIFLNLNYGNYSYIKEITLGVPTTRAFNDFGSDILNKYYKYSKLKEERNNELTLNQYVKKNEAKFSKRFDNNFPAIIAGYTTNLNNTTPVTSDELD
jgi:hypothetical protein